MDLQRFHGALVHCLSKVLFRHARGFGKDNRSNNLRCCPRKCFRAYLVTLRIQNPVCCLHVQWSFGHQTDLYREVTWYFFFSVCPALCSAISTCAVRPKCPYFCTKTAISDRVFPWTSCKLCCCISDWVVCANVLWGDNRCCVLTVCAQQRFKQTSTYTLSPVLHGTCCILVQRLIYFKTAAVEECEERVLHF